MQKAWLAAANHPLARDVLTLQEASFVNGAPWSCAARALWRAGRQVIHWDSENWSEAFSRNILSGTEMPGQSPSVKWALQLEGPHFPAGL